MAGAEGMRADVHHRNAISAIAVCIAHLTLFRCHRSRVHPVTSRTRKALGSSHFRQKKRNKTTMGEEII